MITKNQFGETYWNLNHALAWIYARDSDSSVQDQALIKVLDEIHRRFVPSDLSAVITLSDEDERDDLERDALSSELGECLKQQVVDSIWFDSLEKELINAMRSDKIKCSGINSNTGNREEITATEWIDLKFYYGVPTVDAGPEHLFTRGASKWCRLKFHADEIKRLWLTEEDLQKQDITKLSSIGGTRKKINESLQEAINKIVADIVNHGKDATQGIFRDWFEDKGAVFHAATELKPVEFDPPIPNCDDIYIDGNKLVWKNRDGVEKEMALTSLRKYLDRARGK